jgi:hypothetical protein
MTELEYWMGRIEIGFEKYHLPDYMLDAVQSWVLGGKRPGYFLEALLKNDFMGAAAMADDNNRRLLWEWAGFLYNEVPSECKGSDSRFWNWKGLRHLMPEKPEGKLDDV